MKEFIKTVLRPIYHLPENLKRSYYNKTATIHEKPIFLLGNQKSGTSAIAGLLAELTGKTVAIDLPGILEPIQQRLHQGKLSFSDFVEANKYDFSRDIIKEPSLTFLVDQLQSRFPYAKYVFIIRDPRDNIRSILNRLNLPGHLEALGPAEYKILRKAPKDWERVVDSRWLGAEGKQYIEWMAGRWNLAAAVYESHEHEMLFIRYEDFLQDKYGELVRLAKKLGLEAKNDIRALLNKQYQPAGNRHIRWEQFFGRNNLQRIEAKCGERMKKYGYRLTQFSDA